MLKCANRGWKVAFLQRFFALVIFEQKTSTLTKTGFWKKSAQLRVIYSKEGRRPVSTELPDIFQ